MIALDFERVFAALPSPYMLLDRDLRFVAANATYLTTTGRTLDELRGQYVMDAFPNPGESGHRLLISLRKVLSTGVADTLAYIPYPIRRPDGAYDARYWTAVHTPILADDGSVAFILQNTVDVTEYARLREAATRPFDSLHAETSLIQRMREAEAASADFRRLFQQAPAFFAVLSGPDHIFTFTSDSYQRLIGGRAVLGLPLAEALPEVVAQGFVDLLDGVFRTGITHQAEGARVMLQNAPGKPPTETYLDFSYAPIRAPDGSISGVFVQGMDRTEAVRAQARQRLLIDELNHRVKNAMATVQSIAALTLRTTDNIADARAAFEARIAALSQAHNMLSARQWTDTDLGDLARQELGAYTDADIRIEGPAVIVDAKSTISFALLLHELATNAAKHGALSRAGGSLRLSWSRAPTGELVLRWVERGGPPAQPPTRRGFGSRMLSAVVSGELAGTLDARYEPEGFSAILTLPPSALIREAA